MTITKYPATFIKDTTRVPAAFLNKVNDDLAKAADFSGGGSVSPAAIVTVAGSGMSINPLTTPGTFNQSGTEVRVAATKIQAREGTLGDADATLNCDKDWYRFTAVPTVNRTYTLNITGGATSTQPVDGSELEITMTLVSGLADAIFEDESTTEVARIVGGGNGGTVRFRFSSSAGAWKCVSASGDGNMTVPH